MYVYIYVHIHVFLTEAYFINACVKQLDTQVAESIKK